MLQLWNITIQYQYLDSQIARKTYWLLCNKAITVL